MIFKYLFALVILISLLSISSCSSLGTHVSGGYDLNKSKGMGLIAVSTSIIDKCGSVGNFQIFVNTTNDSSSSKRGTTLEAKNLFTSPDFKSPDGYFAVLEFPAGSYAFTNTWATGLTLMSRQSKHKNIVTFNVIENKVTYIGEVEFTIDKSCNSFTHLVKNKWKRDLNLFKHRIPNINPNTVNVKLAKT